MVFYIPLNRDGTSDPKAGDAKAQSPGPEVIKLFSSSAQLSMKFQLLIDIEIVKISGKFRFKTKKLVTYPAHKC